VIAAQWATATQLLAAARDAEIARHPDLAQRLNHAQNVLARYDRHEHDDETAVDQALADIAAVLAEATPRPAPPNRTNSR
jgi:ribosome-binding protein aMBF1 (putative translation factor)